MAAIPLADVSHVPFYIAGGVLAAWAVVLSAYGLTHPDFPADVRAQRGVIAVSFVLMVIAVGAAITSA
jgi:hypothetical protein